jgi:hypothetical protein
MSIENLKSHGKLVATCPPSKVSACWARLDTIIFCPPDTVIAAQETLSQLAAVSGCLCRRGSSFSLSDLRRGGVNSVLDLADMSSSQTPSPTRTKTPARLNSLRITSTFGFSVCEHVPSLAVDHHGRPASAISRRHMLTAVPTYRA